MTTHDDSQYFHADGYPICDNPFCSNRLSGDQIANGENYCSEDCSAERGVGSDMVLFDDPITLDDEIDDDEEQQDF